MSWPLQEDLISTAGLLQSKPWFDLTRRSDTDTVLDRLARKFELVGSYKSADGACGDGEAPAGTADSGEPPPPAQRGAGASPPTGSGRRRGSDWPGFRNRDRELDDMRP